MKKWPDTGTVGFSDIIDPLKKLFKKMNRKEDIEYEGYDHGSFLLCGATCLSGKDLGEYETRRWSKEDQGRDRVDLILALTFQLGMEQGARSYAEQNGAYKYMYNLEVEKRKALEEKLADREQALQWYIDNEGNERC